MHARILIFVAAAAALAQQTGQQKQPPPPQEKKEVKPAPLFEGKLSTRSSKLTKESASMGFNGIDPSGKVDAQMMNASPGASEQEKAKQLAANQPSQADLAAFLKEGGLNQK